MSNERKRSFLGQIYDGADGLIGGYLPGGVSTDWRQRHIDAAGGQMFNPTATRPSPVGPTNPFQSPLGAPGASLPLSMLGGGAPSPSMGNALYQMVMNEPVPTMAVPGRGAPNLGPMAGPVKPYGGRPSATKGPQSLGDRILGGASTVGKGILDFAGGNDGTNGLMLGSMALSAWDAHQQRKEYEKDRERERELEEEERRRFDDNAPARAALIRSYTSRL